MFAWHVPKISVSVNFSPLGSAAFDKIDRKILPLLARSRNVRIVSTPQEHGQLGDPFRFNSPKILPGAKRFRPEQVVNLPPHPWLSVSPLTARLNVR
jgi:hypothetical protein